MSKAANAKGHKVPRRQFAFYGCEGRLIKVEATVPARQRPKEITVDCPACERTHIVSVIWRYPARSEYSKQDLAQRGSWDQSIKTERPPDIKLGKLKGRRGS